MTLALAINPGDPGHIDDHEEIHELLSRLDGQTDFLSTGVMQGVLGARPAAAGGNEGLFHFATDVPALAYSDGSSWRAFLSPSTANSFAAVQQFDDDVFFGSGRPWYDVMHDGFGALGDGVAADDVAWQAAIDAAEAAGGGIVYGPRPASFYKCTTGLTVTTNDVVLVGAGRQLCELRFTAGSDGIYFDGSASSIRHCGLRGMRLRGSGATGSGLVLHHAVECSFVELFIDGWTTVGEQGIQFAGTGGSNFVNTFLAVTSSANYQGALVYGQDEVFIRCRFQGNADIGFKDFSTNLVCIGVTFEGNASYGTDTQQNYGKTFLGCYWERNVTANFICIQTFGLTIIGGYMVGGSVPTARGMILGRTAGSVPAGVHVTGIYVNGHSVYDVEVLGIEDAIIEGNHVGVLAVNGAAQLLGHYRIQQWGQSTFYMASGLKALEWLGGNLAIGEGASHILLRCANNIAMFTASGSYGGGVKVLMVADRQTAPTSSPIGGGLLYSEGGAGKWKGSSGTVTTFGPAEPHCPTCGRDFVLEWENADYGHLTVCMWCATAGAAAGVIDREEPAA